MSRVEVLSSTITTEQDVFAVRRQGRQLAAALGLESQDQVRVAAALSEVTRQMLTAFGRVTVVFGLDTPEGSGPPRSGTRAATGRSLLRVRAYAAWPASDELVEAVAVTKGLMDHWEVARDCSGTSVEMARRLSERFTPPAPAQIDAIRAELAVLRPGTPLEELAEHNRQLLAALDDVRRQRDELAETNKGVVALYTELSEELEATNRGVVALYAELDQRSTQLRHASEANIALPGQRQPRAARAGRLDPGAEPVAA